MQNSSQEYIDELKEWIEDHVWLVSVVVTGYVFLLFMSEQRYYHIQESMRFLAYAVLIQVVTSNVSIDDFLNDDLNLAHLAFLGLSLGAVYFGFMIEEGITSLIGPLVAVQLLVLGVLGARIYVALRKYGPEFYRQESKHVIHFFYVPCAAAFLMPLILRELQSGVWIFPMLEIQYPSADWFAYTVVLSVSIGCISWYFFEEYGGFQTLIRKIE